MAELPPAQEMRNAAARLKEYADAAKELTEDGRGQWLGWGVVQNTKYVKWPVPRPVPVPFGLAEETELADGGYEPTGEAFVAHARYAHDQHEDWHEAEFFAGPIPEPLARFIATMHPDVALAFAGWLESAAASYEVYELADVAAPLAVARAILDCGEPAGD